MTLSPLIRKMAVENFEASLEPLAENERVAALTIIEALAPLPRNRRSITLAVARLLTMPDDQAERWAQRILAA